MRDTRKDRIRVNGTLYEAVERSVGGWTLSEGDDGSVTMKKYVRVSSNDSYECKVTYEPHGNSFTVRADLEYGITVRPQVSFKLGDSSLREVAEGSIEGIENAVIRMFWEAADTVDSVDVLIMVTSENERAYQKVTKNVMRGVVEPAIDEMTKAIKAAL